MRQKINESIKYLLNEYNRLKKKNDQGIATNQEKEILIKLKKFLHKDK